MSTDRCALGARPGEPGCQAEEIVDGNVREVAAVDRPATGIEWNHFKGLATPEHRHRLPGFANVQTSAAVAAAGVLHRHAIEAGGRTYWTEPGSGEPGHSHELRLAGGSAWTDSYTGDASAARLDRLENVVKSIAAQLERHALAAGRAPRFGDDAAARILRQQRAAAERPSVQLKAEAAGSDFLRSLDALRDQQRALLARERRERQRRDDDAIARRAGLR